MKLKEALAQYKEYTIKLIDTIEKEEFDPVNELLNRRDEIINVINDINYTSLEFKDIANELHIMEFEEKLKDIMIEKKSNIRDSLDKLSRSSSGSMKYKKMDNPNSMFFNKTI